uniref:Uncharacterized protein n=1 Tax=Myoviridae sp. ct3pM2 TaxID=2827658 RepID=A0A8S5TEG6_9CAUD|nr:MAG TPA: hypothetical protein [Myoviridae sp. ct3pM2]
MKHNIIVLLLFLYSLLHSLFEDWGNLTSL